MKKESNGGASLLGSRSNKKVFVLVPGGKGKGEKMTSGGNRRPGTLGLWVDIVKILTFVLIQWRNHWRFKGVT